MIFVIGGCDKNGFSRLSFTEKLNLTSGEWTSATALPGYSKSEFAACELQNDIYISGIQTSQTLLVPFVQCYDPVSNKWSYVSSCPFSQRSISAVTLNGSIYVTGGLLEHIYCYTPRTDSWSRAATLPVKLEGCGLTVCDGKVCVVGGRNEQSVAVDQIWAFDPVNGKLTEEKPLTRCLSYHGCVTVLQRL
ncbi:kelch 35 [Labeo rohita]|uniref:Kelch 35 n=1 Tax=Labeo rohita TaxID=84645 RepID=A0A498NY49_LABRO|nr:kelch 35 [Labeo rohita]